MTEINLVALTGPLGEIGNKDGSRPRFDPNHGSGDWFLDIVSRGVVVVGRKTVDQMILDGADLTRLPYTLAIFTRKKGPPTVEKFIEMLSGAFPNQPLFIAGGRQTYDAFLPFCTNFFIRKTSIAGSNDLFLPPLFTPRGTIH